MIADPRFPELVSLACHDLRTPLATISGFASTLLRMGRLDEQTARWVSLIELAAGQLAEITDDLGAAARVAGDRFDPALEAQDTLELAAAAAKRAGDGVTASGAGAAAFVDRDACVRALAALAHAAVRHGGQTELELRVEGTTVELQPVVEAAALVVLAEELRDLGAASGRTVIEALGGTVERRDESVLVSLPPAPS